MKQTVVPAQVTTVEDRIVGNLGLSQIVLLSLPVLAAGVVFAAFPPVMHVSLYKLILLTLFALLCGGLAIRIKGKIILLWIIVRLRYNVRPGYYVFNKNTTVNRELYNTATIVELPEDEPEKADIRRRAPELSVADTVRVFAALDNPAANVTFTTNKKGNLYVRITEVNQES
jgi:hypothetical protein